MADLHERLQEVAVRKLAGPSAKVSHGQGVLEGRADLGFARLGIGRTTLWRKLRGYGVISATR